MNAVQRGFLALILAIGSFPACFGSDRFGGSVALTSDYVYRGISHSRGHWALQGGMHAKLADDWSAGVWGSTIDHNDPNHNSFELDGFLSYRHVLSSDWQLRANFTHYAFLQDDSLLGHDYDELSVGINFRSRLLLTVAWLANAPTMNYYDDMHGGFYVVAANDSAAAVDLNFIQPISNVWSATFGAGYYDAPRDAGYAYGHAGLTAVCGPVDFQLLYIESERQAGGIYTDWTTGRRWSATVQYKF